MVRESFKTWTGSSRSSWHLILAVVFGITTILANVDAQCGSSASQQDKLALYKVTLRTHWSRARFPRHYPEWRPPAQFGKLIGRTHDSSYTLYRLGERLSQGARQYVETGRADGLDAGGESPNTLHSFVGPPVPQGEGTSIGRAFLDGNHTRISVMARINPSPDWFVGVDAFQLCVEGNWVDTVTVELDPLDGGTDNGFTFTAANWPTQPQGVAYRITSRYPAHPAGSFYYPNLPRLPPLATLTFTKLREYTLTEKYHEDDVEMEFISNDNLNAQSSASRVVDPNRDLNEAIAEERREMDPQRYKYWTTDNNQVITEQPRDSNKEAILHSIASTYVQRGRPLTPTPMTWSPRDSLSKTSKAPDWPYYHTVYQQQQNTNVQRIKAPNNNNIINSNNNSQRKITSDDRKRNTTLQLRPWGNFTAPDRLHRLRVKHHKLPSKGKHPRTRVPRDCKVGEWGPWSACSRSCGVGETQRTRKVTVRPRRGGTPCPPLEQIKWCGSASPCSSENGKPTVVDIHHW
ncbi:uncharacterized protein LOC105685150 [Athalia rosae]|uniref:uncharacterized protein LOC105685150 n=1 Tax=Athalia rosae TaxID=37344 RepID=UPI000625E94E|nr:uncharacterized protein LOC105685150 [Athalia rosae]XP_048513649.1 uncharacterized protein LOC105685150 [Athalia rosae]XP_048513652.1 uncharacterized protein LOC105685150 [Athalia rosae]